MKVLMVHAEYFMYPLKEVVPLAGVNLEKHGTLFKNVLVVFITIEKGDEDLKALLTKAYNEIVSFFKKVHANSIALCPYLYLSKKPASITKITNVVRMLEKCIKEKGITVHGVPYHVEFLIKPYTYSISEFTKTINVSND